MPLRLAMRGRGVRVDVDKAEKTFESLTKRIDKLQKPFGSMSVSAAAEIADYCDKRGLKYGRTATGQPSFQGPWLREHLPEVAELRKLIKARDTFVKGYILDKHVNGRLHGQFNQLKSDDFGTVSGRLSASNPNLQNVSARDEELGPLIRSMFLPDEDEEMAAMDWSQIEFRMFVHYSGDEDLMEAYRGGGVDFHSVVADMFNGLIPRKIVKGINFLLLYGGGKAKLAAELRDKLTETEAHELRERLLAEG
jgi:DNA polymerase-1